MAAALPGLGLKVAARVAVTDGPEAKVEGKQPESWRRVAHEAEEKLRELRRQAAESQGMRRTPKPAAGVGVVRKAALLRPTP